MKKNIQNKSSNEEKAAGAAGLAALVAAAAGAYFLYGSKDATKNRKQVKAWSLKMKGEVLEKIEKLKEVDEKVYQDIIDTASKKYSALKGIDVSELEKVTKELSSHWKNIKKQFNQDASKAKKQIAKTAKKVESDLDKNIKKVKKVVKKSVTQTKKTSK